MSVSTRGIRINIFVFISETCLELHLYYYNKNLTIYTGIRTIIRVFVIIRASNELKQDST